MFVVFDHFLRQRGWYPHALMWALLALIGTGDYLTGPEYSTFTLYLLPIGVAAWYTGRRSTIGMVLACTLVWFAAQQLTGKPPAHPFAPYWNAALRLFGFAWFAYLWRTVARALQTMTAMAMRDELTRLNNARAFEAKYDWLRGMAARRRSPLAIAMLDLDGFKHVNDSFGHSVGNEVLVRFGQVLSDAARSTDVVARLGGDEFAVLLADAGDTAARSFETRVRKLFVESGLPARYGVDFSMGAVVFDAAPEKMSHAMSPADALMYAAKQEGKARTRFEHVAAIGV